MKRFFPVLIIIVLALFLVLRRQPVPVESGNEAETVADSSTAAPTASTAPSPSPTLKALSVAQPLKVVAAEAPQPIAVSMNVGGKLLKIPASKPETVESRPVHAFSVEDGIAVIDGDIALGQPTNSAREGYAQLPQLSFWPTHEIPIYIQPSLENPARVRDALAYFNQTAIKFVEYEGQEDVIVFDTGTTACKSYVGRVGGKQPIWLSSDCGPHEIAHEIMHALGFVHEQNRADRDQYIRLNNDNIDQTKIANFEKMPVAFMQLSGLSEFAFDSIMIYPPSMFSRSGQPTMDPISSSNRISPSQFLSDRDISRINKYYGIR